MRTIIVAIEYLEPEYAETKKCIEATGLQCIYVDRNGVGSLAKAINDGFKMLPNPMYVEFILVITNVTFDPAILPILERAMDSGNYAAIHPSFNSDHRFCIQKPGAGTQSVPFVEFTAPLVRYDAFMKLGGLDEDMPYWGHDLDFGYRARKDGYLIGVNHDTTIGHTYIRNDQRQSEYRKKRAWLRKSTDFSTEHKLTTKYGTNWKQQLGMA